MEVFIFSTPFSQTVHESCRLQSPPNRSATSSRANCPLRCPSPLPSSLLARPVTSWDRCLPKRERDTHTHQQRPRSRRKARRQVTGQSGMSSTCILTKRIALLQYVLSFYLFFFFLSFPASSPQSLRSIMKRKAEGEPGSPSTKKNLQFIGVNGG